MKKLLPLLLLSTAVIGVVKVNAESSSNDYYYTNPNGIKLTEKEYNFVVKMYDEHYLEIMNQDDYNIVKKMDVNNRDVEIVEKEPDYIGSRSTYLETQAKKLVIGKSCSGNFCSITVANTWKYEPRVKSYDVIGVMLVGTTFANSDHYTSFKFDLI